MTMTSFNSTEDNNLTQLQTIDSGTTWTDRVAQPVFVVESSTAKEGIQLYF